MASDSADAAFAHGVERRPARGSLSCPTVCSGAFDATIHGDFTHQSTFMSVPPPLELHEPAHVVDEVHNTGLHPGADESNGAHDLAVH